MEFPKEIYLDGYTYTQMYEHEKGGMYYHSEECNDVVTGSFISLYPGGRLTYLWNGYEYEYGKYDFENSKKIGEWKYERYEYYRKCNRKFINVVCRS